MSKLQNAIIRHYKELFPNDTLKETSEKTNIQITRVFRLLNGADMKVIEYEIFEKMIEAKSSHTEFYQIAKECSTLLSSTRLTKLITQMNHAIKSHNFNAIPRSTQSFGLLQEIS